MDEKKSPSRILRLKDVMYLTGLSRSSIYKYIGEQNFPQSFSLGARRVGWLEEDIEAWILERKAQGGVIHA